MPLLECFDTTYFEAFSFLSLSGKNGFILNSQQALRNQSRAA
jgi:hypothetical protein